VIIYHLITRIIILYILQVQKQLYLLYIDTMKDNVKSPLFVISSIYLMGKSGI